MYIFYAYEGIYIYILYTEKVPKGQALWYYEAISGGGDVKCSFLPACINFLQHKHTPSVMRNIF